MAFNCPADGRLRFDMRKLQNSSQYCGLYLRGRSCEILVLHYIHTCHAVHVEEFWISYDHVHQRESNHRKNINFVKPQPYTQHG